MKTPIMTTNQREKQLEKDLRRRTNFWGNVLICIIVLSILGCVIVRAISMEYKELSDHKSKQIRELQKVMAGCDRCYELMHGSKR